MNWARRRALACVIGCGTAALAGCLDDGDHGRPLPDTPSGTWQQFAHDAGNTGTSDVSVPERGTPAWESGGAETVPPIVAGETVFSVAEELIALDTRTGDERWSVDLDAGSSDVTTPAVTDEQVLFGIEDRVVAFARDDGDELWETPIEGAPLGPTTVSADHQVAIVPFERRTQGEPVAELIAFDTETGDTEWTASVRVSPSTAPPAVFEDRVYGAGHVQEETAVLRGFSVADGTLDWESELDDPETPPIVTPAGVYIGDGGRLRRYEHSGDDTGTPFDLPGNGGGIRAIAVADGTAFVLSDDGLSAVSVTDGSRQWDVDAEPRADGICVGRETVVAPVSSDEFDLDTSWPCVAAFDRSDGTTRWYHPIDDAFDPSVGAPPAIADGAVYFVSNTVDGIAALGDLPPRDEE